jgi:hypothetical protein
LATPVSGASGTTTLSFSDTLFRYIGTPITPGTNINLTLDVFISTEAANPSPTPYPSPTPVNARTITADDLNLINLDNASGSGSVTSQTGTTTALSALNPTLGISQLDILDDTIPPPDASFTPRPTDVPFESDQDTASGDRTSLGDVLSIRSLKELLIPGASDASRSVVFVNLLSTLAFLVILAILMWRLIVVSRLNRVKNKHMKEMLAGELAALESKLTSEVSDEGRVELTKRIDEMRSELE